MFQNGGGSSVVLKKNLSATFLAKFMRKQSPLLRICLFISFRILAQMLICNRSFLSVAHLALCCASIAPMVSANQHLKAVQKVHIT